LSLVFCWWCWGSCFCCRILCLAALNSSSYHATETLHSLSMSQSNYVYSRNQFLTSSCFLQLPDSKDMGLGEFSSPTFFFLNFFLLWPHRRLCYINHKVLLLPHQPNTRGDDRNTLRVHRRLRIPQPLLLHTPHFGTARTFKRNTQQVRRSPPQTPRAHLFFLFVLWCASVFLFFALVLIHLLICIPFLFYTYFRPKNILDVFLMVFS
jgi:hypothetical protein